MAQLTWVRGNPALMTVTLKQVNADGTKTVIDLTTYDSWECKVWRLSSYKKVEGDVSAALNESGQVVLSIPATTPCGIYSVEILCQKEGYGRRSYEVPVFSIVDSNGETHVTYETVPCQVSVDIDMEFQLTPIAETLGKNAYEMWKELPGHEDKTLQEYLDDVVDLDSITAACETATEAAEAAAVIGSHPDYIGEDNYVYHWTNGAYAKTDIYCKGDKGDPGGGGGGGVQSDWNQTDTTADDYIKNKPTIPDVSGKADKATTLAGYGITDAKIASGVITLGSDTITPLTSHQDISSKADKVSSPTNGDFAALDSNGNLTDSGHKHSDYQTALSTQTAYTSKGSATKVPQITTNTLGQVTGITEVTITQPDITGKADKVTSATNGNFAALDSNGNLTDSGHKHGDYLTSHQDLSNYVQKSNTAGLLKNDGTVDTNTYLTSAHEVPAGGNAGQVLAKNSATNYDLKWVNQTQYYPSAYCTTAAGTAAKVASCSLWVATANSYLHVLIGQANTSASALTLNVNSTGAKPIYINGAASSSSNYTLPAGSYLVLYDGTNYQFRTDGKIAGPNSSVLALSTDITDKEDKMGIITVSATSLAPSLNKYYRFTADVGTLAVTLPTVTDTTKVASIVFYLTTSSSPAVTFTSTHSVVYQDGFQLDASKTYEVNALFNGAAWVLMAAEINTGS